MKLPKIKVNQLGQAAEAAFNAGRTFSLYSQGGTGKTTVLKDVVAPYLGIMPENIWLVNLSGAAPQECLGYGIPDAATRDMWFSRPEIWPTPDRVPDGTKTMLILDEQSDYDPAVNSLLRGLWNPTGGRRMVGSHGLTSPDGKDLFICSTGNRRSDGSSRSGIPSAPQVERACSYELEPDLNGWLDWASKHDQIKHSPLLAFLAFSNGLEGVDHFCPAISQPWDGSPHPCPRTWEAAALQERYLESRNAEGSLVSMAIRSSVGEQAGNAAFAFRETVHRDLPLLADIRAKKEQLPQDDPGRQYGLVYTAIRQACRECGDDPEAAVAGGNLDWLVDLILECAGDIRMWAYGAALRIDLPLDQHPKRSQLQGV